MKNKIPSVSIVVPCYNVEEYVRDSVESALGQTLEPKEVICVDDGSEDRTLSILRNLECRRENFFVRSQKNRGASAARNVGLDMCNSEYVCFLDADDILHSEKIEHQASLVAEKSFRPDLIAAASKRVYIDDPSMPTHVSIPHSDKWVGLITSSLGITSSNLWKVSAVRAVGGWSESVMRSTDAELMFKMLRDKATVCRDTVPLTTLRRRDDSLWNRNLAASRKDFLKLRCKIKSFIDDNGGLTEKHKKAFADLFHIIRKVRKEDPSFANRMYYKLIPDGHRPYFGSLYKTIISILGFGTAEKFYEWYAPIRKIFRPK